MIKNEKIIHDGIFAFQKGECIELKNLTEEKLEINENKLISNEFQQISTILQNISITVNKNAEYMRNIAKNQNTVEKSFFNFLQASSKNMNLYFKQNTTKKQIITFEEVNGIDELGKNHCELEKKFLKSFNEEKRNVNFLEKKVQTLDNTIKNLKNDFNNINSIGGQNNFDSEKLFGEIKKEFNYKLNRVQNSMLDYATKDYVDILFSDLKKFQGDETDEIRMIIEKMKKDFDDMKTNDIFNNKNKEDNSKNNLNEKIEDLEKEVNLNKEKMKEQKDDILKMRKRLKHYSKKLKNLISENKFEILENRLKNLENKFFRDEDKNIFELLDDIEPRISILENEIEQKLDREKFFDFVSENFIRKKNYETDKKFLEEKIDNIRNSNLAAEKEYKQLKYNLINKIEDLKHIILPLKEKQKILNEKILNLISTENGGERMYNRLERKIESLQDFFIQKYTAKMNSLATARGLQCLSCGEKNVYPPQTQFLKGLDDNVYCIPNKHYLYSNVKNGKKFSNRNGFDIYKNGRNFAKENMEKNLKSGQNSRNSKNFVKTEMSKSGKNFETENKENFEISKNMYGEKKNKNYRLNSAKTNVKSVYSNKLSDFVNKRFVTGEKVFDKSHIISEHFFKSHLPMEEIIDNKLYKKRKFRPFSSIPKKR